MLTELLDSELLQREDSEMVEQVLAAIAFDQEPGGTYAEGVDIVQDGS